jgi:hypothetical protein
LVLVDVEGAELEMLRGATMLLNSSPKPLWMIEISVSEHQPAGVPINPNLVATFELFNNHGYRAYTADAARRPVVMEEVREIAATRHDTLGVHNFIFGDTTPS